MVGSQFNSGSIPAAVHRPGDKVLELLGIERPETTHTLNDAGNGRRLVQKYQDDIRYCVDDREWYVWDRIRWQKDVVQRIRELAKNIANDIRNDADRITRPSPTGDEQADKEALAQYETRKRELLKWAN